MQFSYEPDLLVMSIIVSMMASYVALDLAGRVAAAEGLSARYWLIGGAVAMGAGIWAMHFIGMLAVKMPIPLGYDPLLTAASLLIAMVTSGFALAIASRKTLGAATLLVSATIMGGGISAMHYTGMMAMQMVPAIRYVPMLVGVSIFIAISASVAALSLVFALRSAARPQHKLHRVLAAAVMGIAISGLHFSGMSAARFAHGGASTAVMRLGVDNSYLGIGIGLVVVVILSLTLLAALFDARLVNRTALMLSQLKDSEEKYRGLLTTTTDAVLLVDEAGIIRYANPAVEQVFGYAPTALVGQPLVTLQPERLRGPHLAGFMHYIQSGVRKLDWRAVEVPGLRADGREIPLELVFSEMQLDGKRLFSSFIRDITERKQREARIAGLSRMQAVLSGINHLIVHASSRQILLQQACQVAVEQGKFRMAMIGVVAGDEVRPVAVHGVDDGYVAENIRIKLSGDDPEALGPTASALREKRVRVCNDIDTDPAMAPWREAALKRGYRSSVTFPLLQGGQLAGCMSLYSGEPNAFDAEELQLVSELTADISHALDFIARDEQLDYLASYDPLTQLANRGLFVQRLGRALDLARQNDSRLATVLLDLSRFAAVNELVGHAGGDAVLKSVADRIVGFAGSPELVGRKLGDRFALLIPDLSAATDLRQQHLEPLLALLGRPIAVAGQVVRVAASAGIALYPDDGQDADSLLRNAETALRTARATNESFLFYTSKMGAAVSGRHSLESKLRAAIENREFLLHYQPKVALDSGAICGAEALIRWNSPELGLVPPVRFIPVLEETGMILEVGHWVLQQAAADHRLWLSQGLRAPRVAVNLSMIQLRRPGFVAALRAALTDADGTIRGIDLEITESVLMTDIELHLDKLIAVRELGIAIAIDDFGTGYSSLAYLNKLPIAAVKIDRSFIVGMVDSSDTMNIVSTIIALAHSMKLKVVAEGVETREQLRFLQLLGCDEMQGYLFSPGVPAAQLAELLCEDRHLALS